MDNHLKEALIYAGLDKLPELKKGAWKNEAIIKVRKVGGQEVYCIGTWNAALKTANIAMDFDRRPEDAFIEAYPFENAEQKAKLKAQKDAENAMRAQIEAEMEIKAQLKEMGVEDASGTLDELKAQLAAAKVEKGDMELAEMAKFLSDFGYKDGYVKTLNIEKATASVDKIKGQIEEVKAFGAEPKGDKDELEDQLKALRKEAKEKSEE